MKRNYIVRKPAVTRKPLFTNRVITINRVPISTAPNNGKFNVILDTNILISALLCKKQGYKNGASYLIIEELKKDTFNLIQPQDLYEEYQYELNKMINKGILVMLDVQEILALINLKRHCSRSFVNPSVLPVDPDDRPIFNTVMIYDVDYIITTDYRDLKKREILGKPIKLNIISSSDFLRKLSKI